MFGVRRNLRGARRSMLAWSAGALVWVVVGAVGAVPQIPLPAGPALAAAPAPGTEVTAVTLPLPAARLPTSQLRALVLLCHLGSGQSGHFDTGVGQNVFGPVKAVQLPRAQQALFDQQWQGAVDASAALATPALASAAGYVQAAPFLRGVGTHWIKWSLVGRPFDPTTPAMLLFDGLPGRAVRLVGFSYWVSGAAAPAAFVGPNDQWHRHAGLCFNRTGWLAGENVSQQGGCAGYWLSGRTLWMLHAWVVPDLPNTWGQFAPTNPYLCPRSGPDILSCPAA